jgi:DNA repair protein RecN (Recombination protein N)
VGEKLWRLTPRHHVLCVTHLPQLACFADAHYSVAKAVVGERTVVNVQNLGPTQRIEEMAAMLGDTGESARQNAQALAERAEAWKKEQRI